MLLSLVSNLHAEAVASLQSEARKVLKANMVPSPGPHVCHDFAIEIDKTCRRVLKDTYGVCCFEDVLTFDATKPTQFCTTHEKKCRIIKTHIKAKGNRRNSAEQDQNMIEFQC